GSAESEFEYVYENKVRPFVSNLYRYSNIQAVLHYSGVLLYWIERTHPEFLMLIEDMITRKQAELLGGGFFEPSFPLIPLQDRIGQIELMTTYIRKHFGKRPIGCWLPQMAWEQHLSAALSTSDMIYTFLSQEQFVQAGIKGQGLFSPCISEDQGRLLTIFPVSLSLENDLANKSFSQVFVDLKNKFDEVCGNCESEKIISIFPDKVSSSAEEAPDTAWNRFFEEISLSENIVETTLPAKFLRGHKTYKKESFPNSSAAGDNYSPRKFLIEHDESGGIYSKMIFTNVLINQLKGDRSRKLNAREELWQAQDSSLFSPGGGHIRGELRKAAYSSLLRAEMMTRENGKFIPSLIQYDFDFDGVKEFIFQDTLINCYIQPRGACIFELDYLPKEWNYLDCGSNDYGRRAAFADVLLPFEKKMDKPEDIITEKSRLCFIEQYESVAQDKKGKSCFKLPALGDDMPFGDIEINKCYFIKKSVITVSYNLINTGKDIQKFKFSPIIYFSFANVTDDYVRFYAVDNNGKDIHLDGKFDAGNLKILDVKNEVQILFGSIRPFSGFLTPVLNNDLYQATIILPVFSISLKSGEAWTNEFSLKFSH
ncbi:alpha-amylase/4-alpha-glucanotransferase domain-containing protein, partial [Treponema sp. R80B11-R83G3]